MKSFVEKALEKAEHYEKEGNKNLAKKFFAMAEKYEEVIKKNREMIPEKTKGR